MTLFTELNDLVTTETVYPGYAATGARLPYVVSRPSSLVDGEERAISGDSVAWDMQFMFYCCAASVEASYNLALQVIGNLDGVWVLGSTITTSIGYIGASVEGHYETLVTVQSYQGGLNG